MNDKKDPMTGDAETIKRLTKEHDLIIFTRSQYMDLLLEICAIDLNQLKQDNGELNRKRFFEIVEMLFVKNEIEENRNTH